MSITHGRPQGVNVEQQIKSAQRISAHMNRNSFSNGIWSPERLGSFVRRVDAKDEYKLIRLIVEAKGEEEVLRHIKSDSDSVTSSPGSLIINAAFEPSGADEEARSALRVSPLVFAILTRRLHLVLPLLENGANPYFATVDHTKSGTHTKEAHASSERLVKCNAVQKLLDNKGPPALVELFEKMHELALSKSASEELQLWQSSTIWENASKVWSEWL